MTDNITQNQEEPCIKLPIRLVEELLRVYYKDDPKTIKQDAFCDGIATQMEKHIQDAFAGTGVFTKKEF